MAANGGPNQQALLPILAAVDTMQSSTDRAQKSEAVLYLDKFQKTPEAWSTSFTILQSNGVTDQAKMFAATTLKGKIVYDLHQLPRDTLPHLRQTILSILQTYAQGPKPIRTQLNLCLANLAIQMLEWKDVLQLVVSTLQSQPGGVACILDFLRILPEEVTEGRKINLSDDELSHRTQELLGDNSSKVLEYLSSYAASSAKAAVDPDLMDCVQSWSREVSILDLVSSPLFPVVVHALDSPDSFDAAVECFGTFIRETKDVDDTLPAIQKLCTEVIKLKPRIAQAAEEEDVETFNGIARIFAEAGETWVLLIAREPATFRPLVEGVLDTCARDKEKDAISHTFNFWFELKQYLTLDKYMDARLHYIDIYSKLVDIMIGHLEYPMPESRNEADLFEGDREQEERFREYRHQMGDVLKDCCEVIGVVECLAKPYKLIQDWVHTYGSQTTTNFVQKWQKLEAPLFALRAMGREVPPDENVMLSRLIPLIVQIPDHDKLRFQAVMALGRYTEWTAQHPEFLESQLNFIIDAFNHKSRDVVRAAALSFRFFCQDCAQLLKDHLDQLQPFYAGILDKLVPQSQEEVTEGVAAIVAELPLQKTYDGFKKCCDPVMQSLMHMAQNATNDRSKVAIADKLQLVTLFIQWIKPREDISQATPAVRYCQEIFPILAAIAERFSDFTPILERVCRTWRYMVLSYRTAITPLLPELATKLVTGFAASNQGCFLWTTDAIIREFPEDDPSVDQDTVKAIFDFYEAQAKTFLRVLSEFPLEELPDLIEDFFRLALDALVFHAYRVIPSPLMSHVLAAACASLNMLKVEPLTANLHFLRDFLAYGLEDSPTSGFDETPRKNPPVVRHAVMELLKSNGEQLTQRLLTGMMFTFPRDCIPDASGVLLDMFRLMPDATAKWVQETVSLLPPGSISPEEQERLIRNINQRIVSREVNKIRALLQDFTNSYRRRNVTPREGLGRLEAVRFHFAE